MLKENHGHHMYKDGREVDTHAYTQNAVYESSFCYTTNASAVAATV
jgi:hypothetical protein